MLKKIIAAPAAFSILFALTSLTACSSQEKYKDDHLITFKGNDMQMPKRLCDQEEKPDISPAMEKKIKAWYEQHMIDGDLICTK